MTKAQEKARSAAAQSLAGAAITAAMYGADNLAHALNQLADEVVTGRERTRDGTAAMDFLLGDGPE